VTLFKNILRFLIICSTLGVLSIIALYYYVKSDIPSVQVLKDVQLQSPLLVFTKDGKLINQFGEKRRIPLSIEQIPQNLINALIATEDSRFYDHPGVDPIGIIRSALVVITTGQKKQGASTLTMQVARGFFLTREKAYIRKIKEIFIALHIEQLLSKDEILELYLNKMEFGNRAFGVGAAAQVYFGKNISELTLSQHAMLAGLLQAPSALNPFRHPQRAKKRRNIVLARMLDEKYITEAVYQEAIKEPITAKFHGAEIEVSAPYISEMVRAEMVKQFGEEDAYNKGFRVYTTIEANTQLMAEKAVVDNLEQYDTRHGYRGPHLHLWDFETQAAWAPRDILDYLAQIKEFNDLKAAVVTDIQDQSITALVKDGRFVTVQWDGLKWARSYLRNSKQGPAPSSASQILNPGAAIWLKEAQDGQWSLSQIPQVSGALVSLNPQDGAIKAIVGGYSFEQSQYNRAVQAKRQVGSNIKPFIYSAALENGFTLASIVNDAPINKWDETNGTAWRPKNDPEVYVGPIRVRRALGESKNVISVRLLRAVGLSKTADYLLNFGFNPADIQRNESLALGSISLTPLELATGMATFANGGHLIEPYFISRIDDANNKTIRQAQPLVACAECSNDEIKDSFHYAPRVISVQNSFLIADALKSGIWGGGSWKHKTSWRGTGWRAQKLNRHDLSGKTGTTNDAVDTWFTGFNRDLLTTTWVGFDSPGISLGRTSYNSNLDKNQTFLGESGAKTALPAWIGFMEFALQDMPISNVYQPDGLISVRIDYASGLLSDKTDHTSGFEFFTKETVPTQYAQPKAEAIFEVSSPEPEDDELF
jgi:penicillin-binding protein 1A